MPKIVDKGARRLEILESYLGLVAREGMQRATSRRLAEELGVATGALWHYFANYEEMLSRAFRLVFERTNERIAGATHGRRGLDALERMIEQIHPLEKTSHDEALVVVSFWGRVATHPSYSDDQRFIERQWHAAYITHIGEAIADGELDPATPSTPLADALVVLAVGYQVEHVLTTPLASPEAQMRVVRALLAPWMTSSASLERLERFE
ncbi:TetR family transcriptional regulator [Microbacterium sp. kSW2-24]|uniref:TetR/AcrR family transcriptional regulator n=1 Tax=Microbacterium galbinum TaxID=2851646 RepID=UPI001FFDD149|nr:TetR family transcriptional regulator C-terminal domain-containing protein [Microbacterium galbinum]MCK2023343.1 TetR family transcriptional regulator [Microbacterium galbinum]